MRTSPSIDQRLLAALGRVLLTVAVVGLLGFLLMRPGPAQETTLSSPNATGTTTGTPTVAPPTVPVDSPAPGGRQLVVPTPDFTLPPVPPQTGTPVRGTWRFVAATANIYTGLPAGQALADVGRLAVDSHVIGLNEVSRARAGQISGWTRQNPHWWFFSPMSSSNRYQGLNAVLVDTRVFRVIDQGVLFGSPASMRGYKIDSRWITWVILEHKESKTRVSYVQTHMDAAVEASGSPRAGATQRVRNNLRYMNTLTDTVRQLATWGEVVVGGDWNVDAAADRRVRHGAFPFTVLESRDSKDALPGLRSVYSELGLRGPPTRSGRWIDYLAVWKRPGDGRVLTVADYRVLTGGYSDHNPVQAVLQISK